MEVVIAIDDGTDSSYAQLRVLCEAEMIFDKKNKKYKDLWKQSTEGQIGGLIQHKWDRVFALGIEATEEDALDMINYLVFLVRKNRGV